MARNEKKWFLRLRIYAPGGDLMADTHPDLEQDARIDDREECVGMENLLARIMVLTNAYHQLPLDTVEGTRVRDLRKRVPTIRVYMSQHNGRCTIKIPYTPEGATAWEALATIQREDWAGWEPEKDAERAARPSVRVAV